MSQSAGTLITTNNATYIPPRFMPGYHGHCPTLKFSYGETYGNSTSKYFQDYRSETLNNSHSVYNKGGSFPTFYSHNPDIVMSNRSRTWDKRLAAPRYELSHTHHDRQEQLDKFHKMSHAHREHYKDTTGEVPRMDHFVLPVKAEDQFKKHLPFLIRTNKYTNDIHLPYLNNVARRPPITKKWYPKSCQRDREMRDVYFEER
ncbi:unnamed protein product [Owenia fusiformis]|uniref:Ciliary microtubule inner protein 2C n=1 Tax=Owenia fusiformis TaxID=6347 RepID=A0A8J1U9S6_OWEFU|nr:unnamed protein product [Owenia fusiformis]